MKSNVSLSTYLIFRFVSGGSIYCWVHSDSIRNINFAWINDITDLSSSDTMNWSITERRSPDGRLTAEIGFKTSKMYILKMLLRIGYEKVAKFDFQLILYGLEFDFILPDAEQRQWWPMSVLNTLTPIFIAVQTDAHVAFY